VDSDRLPIILGLQQQRESFLEVRQPPEPRLALHAYPHVGNQRHPTPKANGRRMLPAIRRVAAALQPTEHLAKLPPFGSGQPAAIQFPRSGDSVWGRNSHRYGAS